MPDLDDDLDDDLESNETDDSGLLKNLRKQTSKQAKRIAELEAQVAATTRQNLAHKAGLSDLSETQMKALLAAHEGEETPEALRATAVALKWADAPADDLEDAGLQNDLAAGERIAAASRNAAPARSGVISPETVASWAPDKLRRLYDDHPDVYEAALRGETVASPPGY